MPLGPNVVLTMSLMAIAPTKELSRALSPYETTRKGEERGGDNVTIKKTAQKQKTNLVYLASLVQNRLFNQIIMLYERKRKPLQPY